MLLADVEVAAWLSVSRNTVWRWAREIEDFPLPVKIGGATRWRAADIQRYIDLLLTVPRHKDSGEGEE